MEFLGLVIITNAFSSVQIIDLTLLFFKLSLGGETEAGIMCMYVHRIRSKDGRTKEKLPISHFGDLLQCFTCIVSCTLLAAHRKGLQSLYQSYFHVKTTLLLSCQK